MRDDTQDCLESYIECLKKVTKYNLIWHILTSIITKLDVFTVQMYQIELRVDVLHKLNERLTFVELPFSDM